MTFLLFGRCGLSEFVKKGKIYTVMLMLMLMFLKIYEKWYISADVKAIYIIKTRYKRSGGCIYPTNFYKK